MQGLAACAFPYSKACYPLQVSARPQKWVRLPARVYATTQYATSQYATETIYKVVRYIDTEIQAEGTAPLRIAGVRQ